MRHLVGLILLSALLSSPSGAAPGVRLAPGPLAGPISRSGAVDGIRGLLQSGKLDFQNTAGLSFGTGGAGFSQYYLSTTTYKPADKLTVRATLGIHNQSYGHNVYGQSVAGARLVIPQVGVLYQPTPNLRIEFGFSNVPHYGYGNPWGLSGF
jgi:hypothetical protein